MTSSRPMSGITRHTMDDHHRFIPSRPCSQMTRYTGNDTRPSSQMTRHSMCSPPPFSRYTMVSPPPHSRPTSVVSRYSRSRTVTPTVRLPKGNPMKCNVCKKNLEYQWILPGLHNFCTRCLEDYILRHSRGKHCHCPICKAGIRLPKAPRGIRKTRYPLGNELVICDACEDSPAFYKCAECSQFYCDKCNKLHLRMRSGKSHHVTILPSIRAVNEKLKVKIYCDDHEHEEVKFFCRKCDTPICRDCKVVSHEGHITEPLKDVVDERKLRVATAMTTARGHLARLKAESVEIKGRKEALVEETEQSNHDIRQHALKIKDIIDMNSDYLIQTIRQQHDECVSKLDTCLQSVAEKIEKTQDLIDTAAIQSETANDVAFVSSATYLIDSLREADIPSFTDKLWRKRLQFEKGPIDEADLQRSLGELRFHAEGLFVPLPAIELQQFSCFNTDQYHTNTTSITAQSDGTAWVCNGYKNKIQRFNNRGVVIQEETTEFDIDDMTTLLDGTILLTEYNASSIRRLTVKHTESFFARTDLFLRGICTSRDGTNVITVGNDVPVNKMAQVCVSKVFLFSITGHKLREIRIDKGFNLFRVCHTVNGYFVVSTGVSGKYLVLDQDGSTKYTYIASGSADGVTCDAHGLTILSDHKDDTLHLLDSKGKPLQFTYTLNKPNAVEVDNRGYIWVGEQTKVRIMKYV